MASYQMVDFAILESSKPMDPIELQIFVSIGAVDRTLDVYIPPSFYRPVTVVGIPGKLHCGWSHENELGMAAMLSTTSYIL